MTFETVLAPTHRAPRKHAEFSMLTNVAGGAWRSGKPLAIAVSGGTTPKLTFQYPGQVRFDWSRVNLFWVDERAVPPGDPQSNYTLAHENWLAGRLPDGEHPSHAGGTAGTGGRRTLRRRFSATSTWQDGEFPVFDIIQQGMGPTPIRPGLFPEKP